MRTTPHPRQPGFELTLPRNTLFNLADATGLLLTCQEGTVWITVDNDPRDVVLGPQQGFQAPPQRRALVYALAPARITVERRAALAAPMRPAPAWPQRLWAWLRTPGPVAPAVAPALGWPQLA